MAFYANTEVGHWRLWSAAECDEQGSWAWLKDQCNRVEFFEMNDPTDFKELCQHKYRGQLIGDVVYRCAMNHARWTGLAKIVDNRGRTDDNSKA